jgi:ubiquinone/menaquinone biosynthesis C-methylase UbiE
MYDRQRDHQVAAAFKTNATYYQMLRQWHERHDGLAVEPLVRRSIAMECAPGARILEAGCGTGDITNWFATQCHATRFFGVDISPLGAQMARESGPRNASYGVADLKALPYASGRFDFAFAESVLEHVVGWEGALMELHRVLKPGGRLLIRVGNGGVMGVRLRMAVLRYLFHRNRVTAHTPTFDLTEGDWEGDWEAHRTQFYVQEIPSDVLLSMLRCIGFSITFFTTWPKTGQGIKARVLSNLLFWPFNHLGNTIVVIAEK